MTCFKQQEQLFVIDEITDIYIQKYTLAQSFYGSATVYGKPHAVIFEKNTIIEQIDQFTLGECTFHAKGAIILAKTSDSTGKESKQCFFRTQDMKWKHASHYKNREENTTYQIESIEQIDDDAGIVYCNVIDDTDDTKNAPRIHKAPLRALFHTE